MTSYDYTTAGILVVDDEEANLDLLADCLAGEGYTNVSCIGDSREVIAAYHSQQPDLILLDLHMPGLDGFEILRLLGERIPAEEYLPILVLTADVTEATKERALSGGAKDFLTKPLNLSEAVLRIGNLLHTRFLHQEQRRARRNAEEAGRRATFLADASHVLARSLDHETTLSVLCRTIVPRLADYCVVDLVREDGTIRRVGAAHVDCAKESLLRAIVDNQPAGRWSEYPAYAALTEGQRAQIEEVGSGTPQAPVEVVEDPEPPERLNPRSVIAVPLMATGLIHGALVLAISESDRRFEPEDLELASELARRAAMTIENARLYNHALEATRTRDELLAIVAHDLRNPLSTVTMGSALLLEEATNPRQRNHAELVGRAAERMNRLIEDLLEAARVQNRKLRIEPRAQPPLPVVNEAVAMLRPLAESRSIELIARVGDNLPLVSMDAARVLQVLSNLVGNALKFTPAGGRIEIVCEEVGDEVRFAVVDTGAGIPADQLPHIFGRFWQASDRDVRGIGLGLSIVRGIVETHGGRVWVESEPGQGTTFFFTLGAPGAEAAVDPSELMAVSPLG
jgi:signal transduction histidine kinase/DNA-binding response OmpR family regulator